VLNLIPLALSLRLNGPESVFHLFYELLQLHLLFDFDLAHYIAEAVVIGDVGVLVFGFVQKLKSLVLRVLEKFGYRLQLIVESHYLLFSAILEFKSKDVNDFIRVWKAENVVIELVQNLLFELGFR
jgi:hypothetical protein